MYTDCPVCGTSRCRYAGIKSPSLMEVMTDSQRELYVTNAFFKSYVDTLLQPIIELSLGGMEARAVAKQKELDEEMNRAEGIN